eukprot:755148-Ditylum_brightwellii.AAC.2
MNRSFPRIRKIENVNCTLQLKSLVCTQFFVRAGSGGGDWLEKKNGAQQENLYVRKGLVLESRVKVNLLSIPTYFLSCAADS